MKISKTSKTSAMQTWKRYAGTIAMAFVAPVASGGCSADIGDDFESEDTIQQGLSGYYRIIARHSGKDVVVEGASTANGANIFQYSYGGSTPNDEWELVQLGNGNHRVINRHSGKDMVIQSASTSNGANVIQYSYGGSNTNDEWRIESLGTGYYRFVNGHSGKVLDVQGAGTGNGANIHQWTWGGANNQQFSLTSLGGGGCSPSSITPYLQVNGGSWQQTSSVSMSSGSTVKFGPHPTSGGSWSWSGCGTGGSSREQTVSPGSSCSATATYTNSCGGVSTQGFSVTVTSGSGCSRPSNPSNKRVGYIVDWKPNHAVQWSKLTHINYAFVIPTSTGGFEDRDPGTSGTQPVAYPSWLQSVVSNSHNNGVKVLVSVGGWMPDSPTPQAFINMAANSTYRNNFINNLDSFVTQYNLDGIDIDWEYPRSADSSNYALFINALCEKMHNRGKLCTAAVSAVGSAGGGHGDYIPASVFNNSTDCKNFDFINTMAYDYNNYDHSTYQFAQDSINYWKGRGVPQSRLVLGVPFYARPSWEAYKVLAATYGSCGDTGGGNYWNAIKTIRAKANLAKNSAGGIMAWEMEQDSTGSNSLTTAFWEVLTNRSPSYYCP